MKLLKILLAIITATLTFLITGCSSSRKSSSAIPRQITTAESRYSRLDSSSRVWTDVNVPFSLNISSPTDFSISGRMKMIHGKSVDISLRVIGIEMARLLITTDSIFATYKLKKTYVAEPITAAGTELPRLMANLQDILMGRPFILGRQLPDSTAIPPFSAFKAEEINEMVALTAPSPVVDLNYAFFIDTDNHLAVTEAISPSTGTATIAYSQFRDTDAGTLPSRDVFTVNINRLDVKASIDWKWNSAKWNTSIVNEWTNPRDYRKVSLRDFFGMIIKN